MLADRGWYHGAWAPLEASEGTEAEAPAWFLVWALALALASRA